MTISWGIGGDYDAWLTEEPEPRDAAEAAKEREDAILDRAGL